MFSWLTQTNKLETNIFLWKA